MKRIFSKEKMWEEVKDILEKECGIKTIEEMLDDSPWIIECDGHEVTQFKKTQHYLIKLEERTLPYIIHRNWTVEVDDDFDNDFKTIKKELKKVFSINKWYSELAKSEKFFECYKNVKDAVESFPWTIECEGKEPINGRIDVYIIPDGWCENADEYKRFEI